MADAGPHSEECANADGGVCHCQCKGTMHGIRHLSGRLRRMADVQIIAIGTGTRRRWRVRRDDGLPPGGGTLTERRQALRRAPSVTVSRSTTPEAPTLPDGVRETIARVRAGLPKTSGEWDAPLRVDRRAVARAAELRAAIAELETAIAAERARRDQAAAAFKAEWRGQRLRKADRERWFAQSVGPYEQRIEALEEALRNNRNYLRTEEERAADRTSYHYRTGRDDASGLSVRLPPEEYERHLDAVLDVGRLVLDEARKVWHNDPEWQRLRRADEESWATWSRLSETLPADHPDVTAAHQRWKAAKLAPLRREQEILAALLGSARTFGGPGHRATLATDEEASRITDVDGVPTTGARVTALVTLADAEQFYPSEWLQAAARRPLRLVASERAFYSAGIDTMGVPAQGVGGWYAGAHGAGADGYARDVTVHELGHRMEATIPGLTHLEFTMVRRRSTAPDGVTLERQTPIYSGDREVGFRDTWANAYAGKTYERWKPDHPADVPWELFQVGMQDLWSRRRDFDRSDDLQQFVIGALLTLGYNSSHVAN